MERRLAAILAADVIGCSRLMAADEKRARASRRCARISSTEGRRAQGHLVKLMGDGALVGFASVVDAVECAAAIQKGVAERQAELPEDQRIAFRIGINIGDILIEDEDVHGDGVNGAARLEQLAEAGGICVSRTACNHAKNMVALGWASTGSRTSLRHDSPTACGAPGCRNIGAGRDFPSGTKDRPAKST